MICREGEQLVKNQGEMNKQVQVCMGERKTTSQKVEEREDRESHPPDQHFHQQSG